MKTTRRFHIHLRPESEGGFTVTVPALPGCITYGRTLADARAMADDAIRAYLASLKKHREALPSDTGALLTSVDVAVGG